MAEDNTTPSVRATIVGLTDVGRVREHNEDSFLVVDRDGNRRGQPGQVLDVALRTASLLVVCDGMGGAAAGEVASRMAADRVAQVLGDADFATATPDQIASLMDRAVQAANTEIYEKARGNPDFKGMGTTLTAAVATPGRLFVSQVGDSRAYLLRKGLLNQITKDQSLIGQLIEEGTLTEEEAEKLGGRNIVLQAVGVEETLRVDTKSWPILRGDLLVLCSDGLSGMIKDAQIREIVAASSADLGSAAQKLITDANANGGRDNITVILARFDGEGLRPPMETEGAIEQAGASFKAPPPPEVPNPMRKVAAWGGVLLALIAAAFFVFRPTKADLEIGVLPDGATVELLDANGAVVRTESSRGGSVRIPDLEFGSYVLRATAERHFVRQTEAFEIAEPGTYPMEPIRLAPKPVTLVTRSNMPDVQVVVDVASPHPDFQDFHAEFRIPNAGDENRTGNVPAGRLRLRATRPGFRAFETEVDLEPDRERVVEVPATDEIRGRLEVTAPAGFRVRVLTGGGDLVSEGATDGSTWARDVRVGTLTVVASAPGYAEFRASAEVSADATARVAVDAIAESVPVALRGRSGQEAVVEREEGGLWQDAGSRLLDGGASKTPVRLRPGRYRVRYRSAPPASARTFEVVAGGAALEIDLESPNR